MNVTTINTKGERKLTLEAEDEWDKLTLKEIVEKLDKGQSICLSKISINGEDALVIESATTFRRHQQPLSPSSPRES